MKNKKSISIKILLLVLSILYIVFLSIDLFEIESTISSDMIKFLSMILVFLISLFIGANKISNRDILFLRSGIFLSLIADYFLLFSRDQYILGVGLFCIVQILYNIRYRKEESRNIIFQFTILFILLLFIYTFINTYLLTIDFLIILTAYYAIALLSATYRAIKLLESHSFPKINRQLIVGGMILFLLCDINVLIFNILKNINITSSFLLSFKKVSFISMWLFYLPSQVLLSLSGYTEKQLEYKNQ